MRRGRGRPSPMDDEGRTVVRAVVHARLLGLRLLSLDAQIVLGPAAATGPVHLSAYPVDHAVDVRPLRGRTNGRADGGSTSSYAGVGQASELLAESAAALSRSRRGAPG